MWKVSKWVTGTEKLKDLGLNVLKFENNVIQTALTNHRPNITNAAHDVLSKWRDQYYTQEEAYHSLYKGLKERKMNQWATQLRQLARESDVTTQGQPCSEKGSSLTIFWIEMFL